VHGVLFIRERTMYESSCFASGAKTHYRPIEAAIRWADLLPFESQILQTLGPRTTPEPEEFPRWKILNFCADRILDGLRNGELPCGRADTAPSYHLALDDPELVVRHVELKAWMIRYYPCDRPSFLFDSIEREFHPAVSMEALNVLMADREVTKLRLAQLSQSNRKLRTEHKSLAKKYATCTARTMESREPGQRSESTYLKIIGGLLTLLLGSAPSGAPYSSFRSLGAIISALLAHYKGLPGLSERTLSSKFAQARRHLEASH
jgi:hypothetical protein